MIISTSPLSNNGPRVLAVTGVNSIASGSPKISSANFLAISISNPSISPVSVFFKPKFGTSSLTPTFKTPASLMASIVT